jgi:hypothetical protein
MIITVRGSSISRVREIMEKSMNSWQRQMPDGLRAGRHRPHFNSSEVGAQQTHCSVACRNHNPLSRPSNHRISTKFRPHAPNTTPPYLLNPSISTGLTPLVILMPNQPSASQRLTPITSPPLTQKPPRATPADYLKISPHVCVVAVGQSIEI